MAARLFLRRNLRGEAKGHGPAFGWGLVGRTVRVTNQRGTRP
jgi:hypothetical protein